MRFIAVKALEPLVVRDKYGNIVYKTHAGREFTIPTFTKFYIKGRFKKLDSYKPVFTNIIYFKPEKNVQFKGIREVHMTDNPNKASIDVYSGTVLLDKSYFQKLNLVQRLFILLHEIGHYFYYTEYKCDTFATAIMLKLGFTPAQVYSAINSTLIDEYRRKRNLAFLKP